jgi:spermidine synthase
MKKTYIEKTNSGIDIVRCYDIIESFQTKYQKVEIIKNFDTKLETLFINENFQSSMLDEFFYHEALVHTAMFAHQNPKDILIIGGGSGMTLREVIKHPFDSITMIDLDEEFVNWCKENRREWHEDSLSNQKINFIFGDALKEIKNFNKQFDAIIIDLVTPLDRELFDDDSESTLELYSKNFFNNCKKTLKENGILVTQSHGLTTPDESYKKHIYIQKNLHEIFKITKPFCAYIESWRDENSFVVCSDSIDASKKENLRINDITKIENKLKIYDLDFHLNMFYMNKIRKKLLEENNF